MKYFYQARFMVPLTYKRKLLLLFNLVFLVLMGLMLCLSLVFAKVLTEQIYVSHQERLTGLSHSIRGSLTNVEDLSQSVLRNHLIMRDLSQTNSRVGTSEKFKLREQMQQEMNVIQTNAMNVKGIYLLNRYQQNQVGYLNDSSNVINGLSVAKIQRELSQNQYPAGHWFFSPMLTGAVFAQHLFDPAATHPTSLGTLMIVVDTSFIQKKIRDTATFNDTDVFLLQYQNDFFAFSSMARPYQRFLQQHYRSLNRVTAYDIQRVNHQDYFFLRNQLGSFHFYYFIKNQQIVWRVIKFEVSLLGIALIVMVATFIQIRRGLSGLVRPIHELAGLMHQFKHRKNLKHLNQEVTSYRYYYSGDEIGILYRNFSKMIISLDDLIVRNYQSKLLTQEMELKSLQAQINPHFLYNTLDSINMLALSKGDDEISEMVTNLALLFRQRTANQETLITVANELKLVDAYIGIQAVRFGKRLNFQRKIQPESEQLKIPGLTIQPILENAIKYGLSQKTSPTTILLVIRMDNDQLEIRVSDDGPGFDPDQPVTNQHLGLQNIRERLAILYQEKATVTITSQPYVATTVTLRLPYRIEGGPTHD